TGKTIVIGTSSEINSLQTAANAVRQAAIAVGMKAKFKSVSAANYINFFTDAKARDGVDGFLTVNYPDYADRAAMYNTFAIKGGRTLPPDALATLRERYHLNDPMLVQYWHWLTNAALHGNLGESIALRENVGTLIHERAMVTFELVAYASVLILLLGIGSGIVAGLRRGFVDSSVIAGTTVFAAIPSFVAAIVLISVFAVKPGWFPALGAGEGFTDR